MNLTQIVSVACLLLLIDHGELSQAADLMRANSVTHLTDGLALDDSPGFRRAAIKVRATLGGKDSPGDLRKPQERP